MLEKRCTKCGELKPLDEFHKKKASPDGYASHCKTCRNKLAHQRYLNSLSPEELKKYKQKKKGLQLKNKLLKEDKFICSKCGETKPLTEFHKNPGNTQGYAYICKNCRNKQKRKYYQNNKKDDPQFKLNRTMSIGIWRALKDNKNGNHWEGLVGYTLNKLKKHLERQFINEMSWDNYGKFWEIDHILPIDSFSFTEPEHFGFRICWALDNLRPLECSLNRSKRNKLIKDKQEYLVL